MVRLDGTGVRTYGAPSPSTQAEVDAAWPHYDALCRETLRDRREEEEYDVPTYWIGARWEDTHG